VVDVTVAEVVLDHFCVESDFFPDVFLFVVVCMLIVTAGVGAFVRSYFFQLCRVFDAHEFAEKFLARFYEAWAELVNF
jgi:hypothetical protein